MKRASTHAILGVLDLLASPFLQHTFDHELEVREIARPVLSFRRCRGRGSEGRLHRRACSHLGEGCSLPRSDVVGPAEAGIMAAG